MITQSELKNMLSYNPSSGEFIWAITANGRIKEGVKAGTVGNAGYIIIFINKSPYLAHRLAWFYMYGFWPNQTDHINHDKADNRICNLRSVDRTENQRNRTLSKNNKSGIAGVRWSERDKRWTAAICGDHLGCFIDKFEAICARLSANNKYGFHENHGGVKKKNRLNKPTRFKDVSKTPNHNWPETINQIQAMGYTQTGIEKKTKVKQAVISRLKAGKTKDVPYDQGAALMKLLKKGK